MDEYKNIIFSKIIGLKDKSKLIDKYLIPQELEKKTNAEISTPYKLRQEMLDKFPIIFWKTPKKVFEPCAGKGGFVVDIVDRFMSGLEEIIPDKEIRYKKILEECLYFGDINPTNIFICKLLIDPYNKYKLNYNEGDTLELDITEKWNIEYFDAVIGNPPYNKKGGIKKGGKNLYTPFTLFAINKTKINGYILYIVPTGLLKTTIYNKKTEVFAEITKHTIRSININECAKHFNVSSTFTYLLIHKDNKKSKTIYDIVSEVKGKKYIVDKLDNFNTNFIPIISTKDTFNILDKCKKENLQMKRVDKTSDIQKFDFDKFIYIKRLDHLNYKKPYLKVFIGDKTLNIKGPILYTKYSNNIEMLLKSKLMAFFNIVTRFDGVIYHNFINMFGIDNDADIYNENSIYKHFGITEEEIKLIESSVC